MPANGHVQWYMVVFGYNGDVDLVGFRKQRIKIDWKAQMAIAARPAQQKRQTGTLEVSEYRTYES